jgi:hypothetical protein
VVIWNIFPVLLCYTKKNLAPLFLKEYFSDVTVFVFIPVGLVVRNASMRKFAKAWLKSNAVVVHACDTWEAAAKLIACNRKVNPENASGQI